ncbi:preprotein translocase subunit SecB [compost metagenome]
MQVQHNMKTKPIKNSPFRFLDFIIAEFKITRSPDYENNGEIEISIDPSGVFIKNENSFQLTLDVNISDDSDGFNIDVKAIGFFEFKLLEGETEVNPSTYFYTNAPAIVFPYIRAYVSSVSALSGLETVNLPVMNLSKLKEVLKDAIVVKED